MSTLPDSGMQEAAEEVINKIGDSTSFVRKVSGSWTASETAVVHKQTALSDYIRTKMGIDKNTDYACWAPSDADIQKGDRTLISGVYWEVYSLNDWGSHLEFGLKKTAVGS